MCQCNLLFACCLGIHADGRYDVRCFAIVGDCPALKLILNFTNHQGYYCCWFCDLVGIHVPHMHKRQYYFNDMRKLRDEKTYLAQSMEAERRGTNVQGHLGMSILHQLLDTPLPQAILIDYLHVTLLRHSKAIFVDLYRRLRPRERDDLDKQLKIQPMPHYFNRRLRAFNELAYVKGTELRNILFYACLPLFCRYLPIDLLAHLSLFVCAIRLWHSEASFGDETSKIAGNLFEHYYRDHESFYSGLQNFVLHLHRHFEEQYDNFGAITYASTFAQEDLIGHVSSNRHGTRYHGDLITYYYSLDFALHNRMPVHVCAVDDLLDKQEDRDAANFPEIERQHGTVCSCSDPSTCVSIYRRCQWQQKIYHSLLYTKCKKSISYFVQYHMDDRLNFGRIALFFRCNNAMFALVHRHQRTGLFSEQFSSSPYYSLIKEPVDRYFFILKHESSSPLECVPICQIRTHCVIFDRADSFVVTPVTTHHEHD